MRNMISIMFLVAPFPSAPKLPMVCVLGCFLCCYLTMSLKTLQSYAL